MTVKLTKCGNLIAQKAREADSLVCLCRVLSVGNYTDMNGKNVEVTEKKLASLVENYNNSLMSQFELYKLDVEEHGIDINYPLDIENFDGIPNLIDHDMGTIKNTVGNVIGKMFLKNSRGNMAIFAYLKVKGVENIMPVADNRWRYLSVQYNEDTLNFVEVSWVIYGADPSASKIMGSKTPGVVVTNNNPVETDTVELINDGVAMLRKINRELFINQKLVGLCKLRKITKAQSYFINKELDGINDINVLSKVFGILDKNLVASKESFIQVPKSEMTDFINTLKNGGKYAINK